MINVNMLKPGLTFQENGEIFVVISAQHSKQGRGQATVKIKVKNLRNNYTSIKSYTGGNKVEKAHITKTDMNYLYSNSQNIILMDEKTFEQIEIPLEKFKWKMNFLVEGAKVSVKKFNNEVLDIELPSNIEIEVISAPNAIKGNTTHNPQKKIIIKTGYELEAPMFIKIGDKIIVSTSDGKYVGKGGK